QIRLSSLVEIVSASRPFTRMSRWSLRRNLQSRYRPSARPSASKPGPRLALEAGTRSEVQNIRGHYSGCLCNDSGLFDDQFALIRSEPRHDAERECKLVGGMADRQSGENRNVQGTQDLVDNLTNGESRFVGRVKLAWSAVLAFPENDSGGRGQFAGQA